MSFFFLMCSERSGSNFTTKLFNGHSNICGPSTKHIINPVARNIFRYKDLQDPTNWQLLIGDIHNLLSVEFSIWKTSFTNEDLKSLATTGDISTLLKNIFHTEAKNNNKQHVFVKENQLYEYLPFLLLHFSEAKFIYQTRDPRDMALSWKNNSCLRGGVVAAAMQWKKDQQQFLKDYYVLQKLNKVIHITYEELISETESSLKNMTDFMDLPYEESMLNFYKDDVTKQNAQMQAAWSNLSKKVMSNNKNKYKNELSAKEIISIESICINEMKLLGYIPEFSDQEIQTISPSDVDELKQQEFLTLPYEKTEGIIANMLAKKVFYEKTVV
jgi:hypothetical protein